MTEAAPTAQIQHDSLALVETVAEPSCHAELNVDNAADEASRNTYEFSWSVKFVSIPYNSSESELVVDQFSPMGVGLLARNMSMVGERSEIGPFPIWTANYLLTHGVGAKHATRRQGDLAGTWAVHYRDENTGRQLVLRDHPSLSTHFNEPSSRKPPPTMEPNRSPYTAETAHQPLFSLVPYLVAGDFCHLEELDFWVSWSLQKSPNGGKNAAGSLRCWRGNDLGIFIKYTLVRSRAWKLRTMALLAVFIP